MWEGIDWIEVAEERGDDRGRKLICKVRRLSE